MSTDIVHWDNGKRNFQSQALKPYAYVTVPFMAAVFIFWAALQLLERRRERKKKQQMREKLDPES